MSLGHPQILKKKKNQGDRKQKNELWQLIDIEV